MHLFCRFKTVSWTFEKSRRGSYRWQHLGLWIAFNFMLQGSAWPSVKCQATRLIAALTPRCGETRDEIEHKIACVVTTTNGALWIAHHPSRVSCLFRPSDPWLSVFGYLFPHLRSTKAVTVTPVQLRVGRERPSKRDGGEKEVAGVGIGEIGSNREDGRVGRETGGLIGGGGLTAVDPKLLAQRQRISLCCTLAFG